MHELFLTATVADADLERAQAVLQGVSGMTAFASVQRVLYFAGPPQPRGMPIRRPFPNNNLSINKSGSMPPIPPQHMRLWGELHQNLSRQSFILQARYPVQMNEFGRGVASSGGPGVPATIPLNSRPATLRWVDFPDPTSAANGGNLLVTQRKKLDIPETKNLLAILKDHSHVFKSELIEESFSFFINNTEYALVRYHRLPLHVNTKSTYANNPRPIVSPLPALPPWQEVVNPTPKAPPSMAAMETARQASNPILPTHPSAVDPAGQWLLYVRRHVLEDTSPEKMTQATEELETVRKQLAGIFSFRRVDRRAHDTRIERPSNMPAPLPQKVRA